MTTTETDPLQAMLEHHRMLDDELKTRVSDLAATVRAGDRHDLIACQQRNPEVHHQQADGERGKPAACLDHTFLLNSDAGRKQPGEQGRPGRADRAQRPPGDHRREPVQGAEHARGQRRQHPEMSRGDDRVSGGIGHPGRPRPDQRGAQAASPTADAARKLSGTDGGGTPAGIPAGRPAQ